MGTGRGYKSECVIDFESAYGEDPSTPEGKIMPINSNGLKSEQALNTPGTITGTRNPVEPFLGNIDVSGDIVIPVDTNAIGHWLRAMFGVPETTGSSEPYTHEFTIGNEMPSLLVEKKFANANSTIAFAKYNGCKVGSWSMNLGGDGELTSTLSMVGAKEDLGTTAYDDAASLVSLDRVGNFQAAIKEGGESLGIGTALDFTLDFGLDTDTYVIDGTGMRGDIIEGIVGISGNITTLFQSQDLLNKAIDSTESSITITLTDGDYSLEIAFQEVRYSRNTPAIEGPQGIRLSLPFQAYYNEGAAESAVKVTLVNAQDGTVYGGD